MSTLNNTATQNIEALESCGYLGLGLAYEFGLRVSAHPLPGVIETEAVLAVYGPAAEGKHPEDFPVVLWNRGDICLSRGEESLDEFRQYVKEYVCHLPSTRPRDTSIRTISMANLVSAIMSPYTHARVVGGPETEGEIIAQNIERFSY